MCCIERHLVVTMNNSGWQIGPDCPVHTNNHNSHVNLSCAESVVILHNHTALSYKSMHVTIDIITLGILPVSLEIIHNFQKQNYLMTVTFILFKFTG